MPPWFSSSTCSKPKHPLRTDQTFRILFNTTTSSDIPSVQLPTALLYNIWSRKYFTNVKSTIKFNITQCITNQREAVRWSSPSPHSRQLPHFQDLQPNTLAPVMLQWKTATELPKNSNLKSAKYFSKLIYLFGVFIDANNALLCNSQQPWHQLVFPLHFLLQRTYAT